ncbi:hypothetical protein PInf_015090 [Phytophthora infestans]|nr:hypothetical protein PInf_015090 [Phytophthora infestans]
MAEVTLRCGVYGEATVFTVKVARDVKVSALQKAIFKDRRFHVGFSFPARALTLYLAQKKDGKGAKWLEEDENLDSLLLGEVDEQYVRMRSTWALDEVYFGANFQPGRKEIHVLVKLPETQQTAVSHLMPPRRSVFTSEFETTG